MANLEKKNERKKIMKLNAGNENQLRSYFEAVFKLSKSGKEFPIDLDEVWMLAYSRKDHAVRDLKENFMQDIDFQPLPIFGEQTGRGGQNKIAYKLSLSCMEFFIARKIRTVFEIYRQVTHKTHEAFTNYENISDHQKRPIQIQNSKDVNAFKYFNGCVDDLIEYNKRNCLEHTGRKPSEWKEIGRNKGLKSKERTSGKEVVRHLQPEAACSMSFVDNLVKQGYPMDKAIALSKKHAMPLFKGMLEIGVIPGELNN